MRSGVLLPLILIAAACAPQKSARPAENQTTFVAQAPDNQKPAFKPEVAQVSLDWQPTETEVKCAADKCPLQVGALIFASAPQGNSIPIHRCTAFLVSSDTIMSNGHCDHFGKDKGFFVSQAINGKKEVREITGVLYKRYTPDRKGEKYNSGRPDVALFSLSGPIRGIPPLQLASAAQITFTKLIVFAIMNSPSENKLTIEKQDCVVRRHESEFPFAILEAPDMIHSFDCRLPRGASGSPMFAPGSEEVQAVHAGGTDPEQRAKDVREKLKRELLPYEKHWSSVATNVRCLDLPGAKPITCTVTDEATIAKRFHDAQSLEIEKLRARRISPANSTVQSRASLYQLHPPEELRFEVVYTPECRRSPEPPVEVPFVFEQAKIQFDEWAVPRIQSLSQSTVNAGVKSSAGNVVELDLAWPAPAGNYTHPNLDLRKTWGTRFRVDLPHCTR